jgi:C-terminal processing protease CtpA/Prc
MVRTRKSTPAPTEVENASTPRRNTRKPAPIAQPVDEPARVEPAIPPPTLLQEVRETKQSLLELQGQWREKLQGQLESSRADVAELRRNLSALSLRVDELNEELKRLKDRSGKSKVPPDKETRRHELVNEPVEEAPATAKPSPTPEGGWLGITVESAVVIADLLTGSPAASAGLLEGDIITRVNNTPILEATQLRTLVEETAVGEGFILHILREGKTQQVRVRFEPIAIAGTV